MANLMVGLACDYLKTLFNIKFLGSEIFKKNFGTIVSWHSGCQIAHPKPLIPITKTIGFFDLFYLILFSLTAMEFSVISLLHNLKTRKDRAFLRSPQKLTSI